jgi:hypothetical protein
MIFVLGSTMHNKWEPGPRDTQHGARSEPSDRVDRGPNQEEEPTGVRTALSEDRQAHLDGANLRNIRPNHRLHSPQIRGTSATPPLTVGIRAAALTDPQAGTGRAGSGTPHRGVRRIRDDRTGDRQLLVRDEPRLTSSTPEGHGPSSGAGPDPWGPSVVPCLPCMNHGIDLARGVAVTTCEPCSSDLFNATRCSPLGPLAPCPPSAGGQRRRPCAGAPSRLLLASSGGVQIPAGQADSCSAALHHSRISASGRRARARGARRRPGPERACQSDPQLAGGAAFDGV